MSPEWDLGHIFLTPTSYPVLPSCLGCAASGSALRAPRTMTGMFQRSVWLHSPLFQNFLRPPLCPAKNARLADRRQCAHKDRPTLSDRPKSHSEDLFTDDLSGRRDFTGTVDWGDSSLLIAVLMHAWPTKDKPSWKGRPPFSQTSPSHTQRVYFQSLSATQTF